MKLRVQNDRCDSRRAPKLREPPTEMQPTPGEPCSARAADAGAPTLQPAPVAACVHPEGSEVHVAMPGESGGAAASSRRSRVGFPGHSHAHSHRPSRAHHQPSPEPERDPADPDLDSGEPGASLSELRWVFRWLQKSLPFLVILCAKLVIQHALGLAVGVGLFFTFFYVNKNIQTQVFLQGHHSKIQCVWQLLFLATSTLLLYYTFLTETLYYCLVFVSPSIEPLGFWEVLWAVGITNFVVKFLYMGIKCLILLPPSSLVTYTAQGRWLMLTEELAQVHQAIAPVPLWFRYMVLYQEADGALGLTLGVVLALLYLILKILGLYGQLKSLPRTVRICLRGEHTGSAATRSQCSEAGGVCPICQGEYKEPRALLCQHIFCDECIALWFNREKSCPLCRTVVTQKVFQWRDGATSPHLHIY